MTLSEQFRKTVALRCAAIACVVLTLAVGTAYGQTFTVLHNFNDGADGATPQSGLTLDQGGKLYGTASTDTTGNGIVFKLVPDGSNWIFYPIYRFQGGNSGASPEARVVFGPEGLLYGITEGPDTGAGVAYSLQPPATFCPSFICSWNENILYDFGYSDGYAIGYGDVAFDSAGNIYGTFETGGSTCIGSGGGTGPHGDGGGGGPQGNVWQLSKSGGSWTKKIIYNFEDYSSGADPLSGVITDAAGNVYGTATACGDPQCDHFGTVFELTYHQGICWNETTLHVFSGNDGKYPIAGLVADSAGNMYGATPDGGPNGGGTVFELSPSGSGWTFQVLYNLTGTNATGPWRAVSLDAAGNVYGTTYGVGAFGYGSIFKLSPGSGGWTYTDLHDFTGGNDGGYPLSNVAIDAHGNLYGTASVGGTSSACSGGCGTVWEITP